MADEEEDVEQQQENEEEKKPQFNYDELEEETESAKAPFLFKKIEKKIYLDYMRDVENNKTMSQEDGGEAGEFDKEAWIGKYREDKGYDENRVKSVVLLGVCRI